MLKCYIYFSHWAWCTEDWKNYLTKLVLTQYIWTLFQKSVTVKYFGSIDEAHSAAVEGKWVKRKQIWHIIQF